MTDPVVIEHIRHLEIVLKISERCNLNCKYCYIYNRGNDLANHSPAIITRATLNGLIEFLSKAQQSHRIDVIQIAFHGGEPLMMKKARFAEVCEDLLAVRQPGTELLFAMQTNGTLIDAEWIELFGRYNVQVNVSLDGTKDVNDVQRIDKRGRGTYDQTVRGLRLLQDAYSIGAIPAAPEVLSVISPMSDGASTYHHFTDDLGLTAFDFLIPDDNHDDAHVDVDGIGDFLLGAFDEWASGGERDVSVRLFDTHARRMVDGADWRERTSENEANIQDVMTLTVGSDGNILVDDTLRCTNDAIFNPMGNVSWTTLTDVLGSPQMLEYLDLKSKLPAGCTDCVWSNICSGGRLVNRFTKDHRFSGKTVFCTANRRFLSRAASQLISAGLSEERLVASLEARRAP